MANAEEGNLIYVDTAGQLTTQPTKVAYVIFQGDTVGDTISLGEGASTSTMMSLTAETTNNTKVFDFSRAPLYFPNGIFAQTVDSGVQATLVITQGSR